MIKSENIFDLNDRLTLAVIFGNCLTGVVPKDFRQEGETKGEANRRRTSLLNLVKKYPREAGIHSRGIHNEAIKLNLKFRVEPVAMNEQKSFEPKSTKGFVPVPVPANVAITRVREEEGAYFI